MKAKQFDEKFDKGIEDITGHLELSKAKRKNTDQKRINVDIPQWMIEALDNEAKRIGVTRQSIIKLWLAEKIEVRH